MCGVLKEDEKLKIKPAVFTFKSHKKKFHVDITKKSSIDLRTKDDANLETLLHHPIHTVHVIMRRQRWEGINLKRH